MLNPISSARVSSCGEVKIHSIQLLFKLGPQFPSSSNLRRCCKLATCSTTRMTSTYTGKREMDTLTTSCGYNPSHRPVPPSFKQTSNSVTLGNMDLMLDC